MKSIVSSSPAAPTAVPRSSAEKAGLQPGDRIVSIDNNEVMTNDDLTSVIQQHQVGDTLSLTVARDGQMMSFDVTLGEKNAPSSASAQTQPNG